VPRVRPTPRATRPAPSGSARTAALALLGRRDYTEAELRRKLAERGFPAGEIDAALVALRAERLVDDRRAALAHIRTGTRIKTRGRHRLRRELEVRGIDPALADELLGGVTDDDEVGTLRAFLDRRGRSDDRSTAGRRRLFQQLLRRGFSADVVARALRARRDS
jgi:regulatory protein